MIFEITSSNPTCIKSYSGSIEALCNKLKEVLSEKDVFMITVRKEIVVIENIELNNNKNKK